MVHKTTRRKKMKSPREKTRRHSYHLDAGKDDCNAHARYNPWQQKMASRNREETVLGPLSFRVTKADEKSDRLTPCLLCDEKFGIFDESSRQYFLRHLFSSHHIVIGDVDEICNLSVYCSYWKSRLRGASPQTFMSVIKTNSRPLSGIPEGQQPASENYFLLSHALPEDASLRQRLQLGRLHTVLSVQERERTDRSFRRKCLFCSQVVTGNRTDFFTHMLSAHRFSIGNPDNLVYTDELLDLLEKNLESNLCLYCEKTFRDRHTLKDHIRKKQHRKINPKNRAYDRFYIINYLELGKTWEDVLGEEDVEEEDDNIEEENDELESSAVKTFGTSTDAVAICDARSATDDSPAVCLFCNVSCASVQGVYEHMSSEHLFSVPLALLKLPFYDRVKVINFVRQCVVNSICIACQAKLEDNAKLLAHMTKERHFIIPDATVWNDTKYLFPTYENDALLMELDDDLDGEVVSDDGVAVAELLPEADDEVAELARTMALDEKR